LAKGKVIISCAVTGAIHTPSMSPHLPITAAEIAEAAVGAAEAGAAIIHLHARNPVDGRPDQNPDLFEPFLKVIKQRCDAVINLTTGGHPSMTLEERLRPATRFQPEVASLNMGTMGFGLFPMLSRYKDWKHDWEPQVLEASRDLVFKNTYKDIEGLLALLTPLGTRFEFECYDTSHLYNLAHFLDRGLVKAPLFVQTCFGILGGIGGHVRVGLEDSLWGGAGRLAETNAEQVASARSIIEGMGLSVATPDEARAILALKGGDRTEI
jgi:uncharacterized protein (DUF849 family)